MSIYMLDRGITPAGALMAGVSAHFIGAPYTVVGMGAMVLALAAVVVAFLPSLRKVRLSAAPLPSFPRAGIQGWWRGVTAAAPPRLDSRFPAVSKP